MISIGVNALYLIPGGVGGTEIYLRNLLGALAEIDAVNQYVVFTNRETGADLVPDRPNFVRAPQPVSAAFRPARIIWEQLVLPFAVRKHRLSVLFNPGFTAPLLCPCPMVSVFHDLQHKRHPEYFRWFDLPFWNFFLWASARRSSGLLAVSQATADDLERFYGRNAQVVQHGVEREFLEISRHREPRDYLLCASTTHPHKNLQRLLRVHSQTKNAPRLVITGVRGFAANEIESLAGDRVEITGWIPREQLYELYRGALGFIYPSTFEGFGMPVLEAMAAGIPVACSDIPPLREIARSTVHFFDPASDREIRDALLLLASGKISTDAAQLRASQFSWEKTARATLDYLSKSSS
ncbi:MAG TPA: glycosyltransferase family 1 protein [Bryobacteraceae bacterium]|jgi:glycosyltransferase involved in cell wall biosynthesis|nr:glycosyltransferase family 1 protein [Bryobacteraceae bacterium]